MPRECHGSATGGATGVPRECHGSAMGGLALIPELFKISQGAIRRETEIVTLN